jgi:hypothetical protein
MFDSTEVIQRRLSTKILMNYCISILSIRFIKNYYENQVYLPDRFVKHGGFNGSIRVSSIVNNEPLI